MAFNFQVDAWFDTAGRVELVKIAAVDVYHVGPGGFWSPTRKNNLPAVRR